VWNLAGGYTMHKDTWTKPPAHGPGQ
jgi:hypothetical protein